MRRPADVDVLLGAWRRQPVSAFALSLRQEVGAGPGNGESDSEEEREEEKGARNERGGSSLVAAASTAASSRMRSKAGPEPNIEKTSHAAPTHTLAAAPNADRRCASTRLR